MIIDSDMATVGQSDGDCTIEGVSQQIDAERRGRRDAAGKSPESIIYSAATADLKCS